MDSPAQQLKRLSLACACGVHHLPLPLLYGLSMLSSLLSLLLTTHALLLLLLCWCRISLPAGALAAAAALGKPADWLYCSELLDAAGIVVVPGSGFGQKQDTLHFRTTFLPPEEDIEGVVQKLGVFHRQFLHKYGGL